MVIGGGTAGSVLASRLSEDPAVTVVLAEAGALTGPATMAVPSAWPKLLGTPVDWAFRTAPQTALGGRNLPYPRGKVLGGTSAINGMMHVRAHREGYDSWARGGALGWGFSDLLPHFRRSEDAPGRDPAYRGLGGPMQVLVPERLNSFELFVLDAAVELGLPVSPDLNGADQEGFGWVEQNIVAGRRQSASDAYLSPVVADRPNLTIVGDAIVGRLVFAGTTCTGVEVTHAGRHRVLRAAREVVLCGGAIGTPQLLLVSGVGPAARLSELGIDVRAHLPGVGANLQDHSMCRIVRQTGQPVSSGPELHAILTAMLRTDAADGAPDVQLFFWDVPDFPMGRSDGYAIGVAVLRPRSRGSLTLASADPAVAPVIDPGLLTAPEDIGVLEDGMRIAREVAATKALAIWGAAEIPSGDGIREYLRATAHSGMHPVGTCRIGLDSDAVVDSELRVHGVSNLRVADASVMPGLVGANPNATVLAIAERAAALISGKASKWRPSDVDRVGTC
ncbi:GMC family oxidoreductase [Pseudonocardia xinjiangensis]|uniref:GMC family oxidoreductase n=1 Tax=Pseudonocardia xinjiangensis TaxID=75289 RepID=UPI003D93434A